MKAAPIGKNVRIAGVTTAFLVFLSAPQLWAYTQSSVNPRWWDIKGQSILPIGAGEHYGSVCNKCFDYTAYLDAMAAYDQTITQLYGAGWYIEQKPGHRQPA